jgi:putative oxidoreductase
LLRLIVSAFLLQQAILESAGSTGFGKQVLPIIAAGFGLFLTAGLFTPMAGIMTAIVELLIAASRLDEVWPSLLAASIASSLAMLGPGAWSLDAHYFGRKRIPIPKR